MRFRSRFAMKRFVPMVWLVLLQGFASAQSVQRVPDGEVSTGVYRCSGILWNGMAQGSATVVRHPRIAASAAHVVFDDSAFSPSSSWMSGNFFVPGHHSGDNPADSASAKALRGFWNFSSYGGTASDADFHADVVMHYAYESLAQGEFVGWVAKSSNTTHPLNLSHPKILVGYASTDSFFMNRTGPFSSRFRRSYGMHLWNQNVAVISGMSGGGAFARTSPSREYALGGVIVSGNPKDGAPGSGVRAFDSNTNRLMSYAIQSAARTTATTVTVSQSSPVQIPDNSRTWTTVTLPVSGLPTSIEEVVVSLSIDHTWIGDLEVVLRSPSRRTLTLFQRQGDGLEDLQLSGVVASASFRGTAANGNWELLVRDLEELDSGTLDSFELKITAR
jgi:subtilisin-like proprotein convertase family protein